MKLNKIQFENFKCFDDLSIDFGPITLLTGANSSGKSSILYGILGAIQSEEFPLAFSTNGKYIRLGDFKDIVYNHDIKKNIKLSFEFLPDDGELTKTTVTTIWNANPDTKLPLLLSLEIVTDYYKLTIENDKLKKYTLTFDYDKEKDPMKDYNTGEIFRKVIESLDKTFQEFSKEKKEDSQRLNKFLEEYSDLKSKIKFSFGDTSEISNTVKEKGNFILDQAFSSIKRIFDSFDSKLNFISSFRLYPERTYYEKSNKNLKVGKYGENYEDQLISWETNKTSEYDKLIKIMNDLNLLDSITAKRIQGGRYEILVKSQKKAKLSSLSDVGFGISQFLPIIIADLQLDKASNLFIAQPEIHLHPKVQAQFGNYLADQCINAGKRYLIETHSEYLINRLRLLVVKGILKEEDIKAYFLINRGSKVEKHFIKFLKNGKIEGAPQEFFDTYMIDVFDIALNSN